MENGITIVYLDRFHTPVARKEDATIIKLLYPDGRMEFVLATPPAGPAP